MKREIDEDDITRIEQELSGFAFRKGEDIRQTVQARAASQGVISVSASAPNSDEGAHPAGCEKVP